MESFCCLTSLICFQFYLMWCLWIIRRNHPFWNSFSDSTPRNGRSALRQGGRGRELSLQGAKGGFYGTVKLQIGQRPWRESIVGAFGLGRKEIMIGHYLEISSFSPNERISPFFAFVFSFSICFLFFPTFCLLRNFTAAGRETVNNEERGREREGVVADSRRVQHVNSGVRKKTW